MPAQSRMILAAGFGGLLCIMALAGLDTLRGLHQFRRSDQEIRNQYLSQNHVLNDIRSQVYVSGTYVRDYLLEPDPERADAFFRSSLQRVRGQRQSELELYQREMATGDHRHYSALRSELAACWAVLNPIFQSGREERRRSGYGLLRDEVFPRRQNMLAMADRIASLNAQQLDAANQRVVSLLLRFQTRLLLTLMLALAVGLLLALFTMRKILHLENHARVQYLDELGARTQLEALSARLVQTQEVERRALWRELHDEVDQSLSAVLIELRNLSAHLLGIHERVTRLGGEVQRYFATREWNHRVGGAAGAGRKRE